MTRDKALQVLAAVQHYYALEHRTCSLQEWVALKFSCGSYTAARKLDAAVKVLGKDWRHTGGIYGAWASADRPKVPRHEVEGGGDAEVRSPDRSGIQKKEG